MSVRLIDGFGSTDELAEAFSDEAVLGAMLRFEIALARVQERLGMIPAGVADLGLDRGGRPGTGGSAPPGGAGVEGLGADARRSGSLAIPFVKALRERAGDFVHWGATSQDLLDTALVLMLRDVRGILAVDHARVAGQLRELSERHAGTVMLARTVLQPALPTTFGYKVAGWYAAVCRSWSRLSAAFDEALQLQLGGAAGTLAAYGDRGPELAAELAKELDLRTPVAPWHTQRDSFASLVAQCGVYCGALAKIARDVALLMQAEIGEVAERGGGSSAMPQKRNPAGSVVALAAAARVPGLVAAFLSAMPQEHERAAGGWQAEWPLLAGVAQSTGSALRAVAETIEGLTVDAERMKANLAANGAVFAEKAMVLLVPRVGRVAAEKLVADALNGPGLRDGLAHALSGEELRDLDRPEEYLGAAETFRRRLLEDSCR